MDVGSGSLQRLSSSQLQLMVKKCFYSTFIVGNLTSCLVSLGQLYQGGWTIHKDDNSNRLSLQSPGNEAFLWNTRIALLPSRPMSDKDTSGMDVVCKDGQTIGRTKAVRKINNQWDAEFIIGMTDGPMDLCLAFT
jgi:hypothetical protein